MRAVVQRSQQARVEIAGEVVGEIEHGFVVLLGVTHEDTEEDAFYLAEKIAHLRIFDDEAGKMNHSVLDTHGAILSISQFTLYADCRKGRRPHFMQAAKPEQANELYERFNSKLREKGIDVQTGQFGDMMNVHLHNDGPVTLIVDSQG